MNRTEMKLYFKTSSSYFMGHGIVVYDIPDFIKTIITRMRWTFWFLSQSVVDIYCFLGFYNKKFSFFILYLF